MLKCPTSNTSETALSTLLGGSPTLTVLWRKHTILHKDKVTLEAVFDKMIELLENEIVTKFNTVENSIVDLTE